MDLENGWFKKGTSDNEQKSLNKVIEDAVDQHEQEINAPMLTDAQTIMHQLDEIDAVFNVPLDRKTFPSINFKDLKHELIVTLSDLHRELENFTEIHPTAQYLLGEYKNTAQAMRRFISTIEDTGDVGNWQTEIWNAAKEALSKNLQEVETIATQGTIDEAVFPQTKN